MNNRATRISIAILLLLLMIVGTVYGWRSYANRRKLQQLLATSFNRADGQRPSREQFEARRAELNSLPQAYRQQYWATRGQERMAQQYKDMESFFKLSKPEQAKELDKRIAEEEKRRKDWEERRKQREAQRAQSGGNGNNNGGRSGSNGGGSGNGGGQNGPGPGGPGGWGGNRGLAGMLDRTTPEFRAMMSAYRQAMAQRRAQLGLPPRPPRRQYL